MDPLKYRLTIIAPNLPELKVLLNELRNYNVKYVPLKIRPSRIEIFLTIAKEILINKHDLVHSQGITAGIFAILLTILTRTPHLLTIHDMFNDNQFNGIMGIFKKTIISILLSLFDKIHLVSEDSKENIFNHLPLLKQIRKNIIVLPHGIKTEMFINTNKRDLRHEYKLPPKSFLIGFLGRFMSPKGFVYLINALEILIKKYKPNIKPIVLTFSEEDGYIREEKINVINKGLEEYVYFLPFTPEVASTIKGLDVVVMPSLWEACGLLAMETMIAGVPLIGTNCIGLRETIRNTPTTIVPVKDSEALASALNKEINCPTKINTEKFIEEAVRRFNITVKAQQFEKIINKMIKKRIS